MAEPMHDPAAHYSGAEPVGTFDLAQLDVPSTDDDWLEGLIDYALGAYEVGAETPAEVGALLVHRDADTWPKEAPPEVRRRWTVTDDGSAEWAMGHVLRADLALADLAAQAQVWRDDANDRLDRIDAWFAHGAKRHLATKAFMQAHLVAYALDRREADPKHGKTLVLPSGVVKTTEHQPKVAVDDDEAVVAWTFTGLTAEEQKVVAPEQPRKLYVQPLRDHTSVVEVIDHARLVLANSAEVVEWVRHGAQFGVPGGGLSGVSLAAQVGHPNQRCPEPGDGWPSPEHVEPFDLVARVEVLASHLEVHGPDGQPVPGTHVEPGSVTAKVVPAP